MRVLITSDWYKPVINGVVTSVDNLCKGLTELGHEVKILTLSGSISSKKEGSVYYVGSISAGMIYENARLKLMLPGQFLEEIREWRPDVIHSQCEFSTFSIARELARECQIPIVHTYHTIMRIIPIIFVPIIRWEESLRDFFPDGSCQMWKELSYLPGKSVLFWKHTESESQSMRSPQELIWKS